MIARVWEEHCSAKEWGNEVMRQIAAERFAADPTLDVVRVYEHGGWSLSFRRDGKCVGSANDMAVFPPEVRRWRQQFEDFPIVGYRRRDDGTEFKYQCYYPTLANCA